MVSGRRLRIDGKWYCFDTDGSLAESTKIDDEEVEENGAKRSESPA